jgi:hypothetical protein
VEAGFGEEGACGPRDEEDAQHDEKQHEEEALLSGIIVMKSSMKRKRS